MPTCRRTLRIVLIQRWSRIHRPGWQTSHRIIQHSETGSQMRRSIGQQRLLRLSRTSARIRRRWRRQEQALGVRPVRSRYLKCMETMSATWILCSRRPSRHTQSSCSTSFTRRASSSSHEAAAHNKEPPRLNHCLWERAEPPQESRTSVN